MMKATARDSFSVRTGLKTGSGELHFYSLALLEKAGVGNISRLPFSIKVLLESVLRNEDGAEVTKDDAAALASYNPASPAAREIPFKPARVLMQDFTGVPCL